MSYLTFSFLRVLVYYFQRSVTAVVRQSRECHRLTFTASAVGKQVSRTRYLQSGPLWHQHSTNQGWIAGQNRALTQGSFSVGLGMQESKYSWASAATQLCVLSFGNDNTDFINLRWWVCASTERCWAICRKLLLVGGINSNKISPPHCTH